jgi:hypothetical protein
VAVSVAGIDLSKYIPSLPNIGLIAIFFLIFIVLVFFVIVGALVYIWNYRRKQFWMKVPITEEFKGREWISSNDLGKPIPVGNVSNALIQLKTRKSFLAYPRFQFGVNTFLHHKTPEGDLVNYSVAGVNTAMREAGIKPLPAAMRGNWVHTNNLLKEAYQNKIDWQKWLIIGAITIIAALMIITSLINSYNEAKFASAASASASSNAQSADAIQKSINILAAKGGTSGLVPAGGGT